MGRWSAPPKWAGDLNYGYGSPLFIFFYPLPGYISVGIHLLGFSLEASYIALAVIATITGALFMYLWRRSAVSAILFTILPYRALTLYVRGGIGEYLAFSILPLIFYGIEKSRILTISFAYFFLMLSHNAVSVMFTPVIMLYALIRGKTAFSQTLVSILLGLGMSAYFWIPALFEAKYTNALFYFKDWYQNHFASFTHLIYSPWGFGPNTNESGGLSPQIGIAMWLVVALAAVIAPKRSSIIIFWLFVFFLGIFLSTPYSLPLWNNWDFLKKFQFPWRFTALPAFASVALAPYISSRIRDKKLLIGFAGFALVLSLPFLRVNKYISYPDSYYYTYPGSTYFFGESTTVWSAGDPGGYASSQFQILSGVGTILNPVKRSTYHSFTVEAQSPVKILDNTLYYPGWLAYNDGIETPIEFQDTLYPGIIEYSAPAGTHVLEAKFTQTRTRKFADIVSLASISLFVLLFRKKLAKFRFHFW